jgi:hypothetical protein
LFVFHVFQFVGIHVVEGVVREQLLEWDDKAVGTGCCVRIGRCAQSCVWRFESIHSVYGGASSNYVVERRWWCGSGEPEPVSCELERSLFCELAHCYEGVVQCRKVEVARYGEEAVTKAEKCCASADAVVVALLASRMATRAGL